MQNKKDAAARAYHCGTTVIITPVIADGIEAAYDHTKIQRIHEIGDSEADIARSLEKCLSQYRTIDMPLDADPSFARKNDQAFEQLLRGACRPLDLPAIYRELRFVEVVRIDGVITFIPGVGNGEGWFRPLYQLALTVTAAEAVDPDVVTGTLLRSLNFAAVDLEVYSGKAPPPIPERPTSGSALVDMVMPLAGDAERAEATKHWFGFLETLFKIVEEREEGK